jgi:hypothetical protein
MRALFRGYQFSYSLLIIVQKRYSISHIILKFWKNTIVRLILKGRLSDEGERGEMGFGRGTYIEVEKL